MIPSKKDPMVLATTKVSVATVAFTQAAEQLDEAAHHLVAIAAEADEQAASLALRAADARKQATDATRKAERIRGLLA